MHGAPFAQTFCVKVSEDPIDLLHYDFVTGPSSHPPLCALLTPNHHHDTRVYHNVLLKGQGASCSDSELIDGFDIRSSQPTPSAASTAADTKQSPSEANWEAKEQQDSALSRLYLQNAHHSSIAMIHASTCGSRTTWRSETTRSASSSAKAKRHRMVQRLQHRQHHLQRLARRSRDGSRTHPQIRLHRQAQHR